ncbi:MAG: SDR family NAD(P)-dependent oxidoreductase [Acidobacteriota bacterium]
MNTRALAVTGAAVGGALLARSLIRRYTAYDLHDRVALVTGGSRGLGLVLARELASRGAKVAICARDPDELATARTELLARGARVVALPCDVTDRGQLARLVADVHQQLGLVDVLVNNAGVIQVGPMKVMTVDDYEQAMATHFWAPLHLMMAVLPEMLERGEGRIVNIASLGGKIAMPHLLPYTASKFALVGLSQGMRAELAKDGIAVTTVIPGLVRTGGVMHAIFKGQFRDELKWFAAADTTPLTALQAERTARRIVEAMCHGDLELILSAHAHLATRLAAIAPSLTQRALALVDRVLPKPGGIDAAGVTGAVASW